MGERTLVVRQGDLEALEAALQTAHDALGTEVTGVRDRIRPMLTLWAEQTGSRQAQMTFEADLLESMEEVRGALLTIKTKLGEVREDARQTEIRCVAILDD